MQPIFTLGDFHWVTHRRRYHLPTDIHLQTEADSFTLESEYGQLKATLGYAEEFEESFQELVRERNLVAVITSLEIEVGYRGQGEGTRLMAFAIRHIKQLGGQAIYLLAADPNHVRAPTSFYQRLGFRIEDWDEEDSPYMRLGMPRFRARAQPKHKRSHQPCSE